MQSLCRPSQTLNLHLSKLDRVQMRSSNISMHKPDDNANADPNPNPNQGRHGGTKHFASSHHAVDVGLCEGMQKAHAGLTPN